MELNVLYQLLQQLESNPPNVVDAIEVAFYNLKTLKFTQVVPTFLTTFVGAHE